MGTDRTEIYSSSCPCGNGEMVINSCTPDHGWPTRSKWMETDISCPECSKQYELIIQDQQYILVKKSDYKAAHETARIIEKDIGSIFTEIQVMPETKAVVIQFTDMLADQESMAARHRLLISSGLEHSSIATFRKRWVSEADWVRENVNVLNLDRVIAALNSGDEKIIGKLKVAEDLEKQRKIVLSRSLPVVGKPLMKVSRDLD